MKKRVLYAAITVFLIAAITGIILSFTGIQDLKPQVSRIKYENNLLNLAGSTIDLNLNNEQSSKNVFILVEADKDFSTDELQLVLENNEIATAAFENVNNYDDGYSDWNYVVKFNVTGLSEGSTTLYVQTLDGKVKSNETTINVEKQKKIYAVQTENTSKELTQ